MMLSNFFHKDLLDEIIRRGALEFIDHDKDGHQQEEEDLKNDASMLSSDRESKKKKVRMKMRMIKNAN